MLHLRAKPISSLEKCFLDDRWEDKTELREYLMLRNERLSFQIALTVSEDSGYFSSRITAKISGLSDSCVTLREVVSVPVRKPTMPRSRGAFVRTEPGLYPDLLRPMPADGGFYSPVGQLRCLWVDVEAPDGALSAGRHSLTVHFFCEEAEVCSCEVAIRVLDIALPPQTLIRTEWFHADAIANSYHTKPFSERYWEITEAFLRTAVKNGINMILTPLFTLKSDTHVGGERLTTQLVDIELLPNGSFAFGFDKLGRWIDLCLDCGVEYFEMPHLFSHGSANAAPKIVVKSGTKKKKLFDWHTDPTSEEYAAFLRQFLPAVVGEFRKRGLADRCYFHIADEPRAENLDRYLRCKQLVAPYIGSCPIIDALSDFSFYQTGALQTPVPFTGKIEPFLGADIPQRWAYYAASSSAISNRMLAMPLCRTRIIGVQLYYYRIQGFLHWGYNFYNDHGSHRAIDPFLCTDGEAYVAGDTFLVYPGKDKTAWESLRLNAMREAVDDMRALALYEEKFGREATERLILEGTDGKLTFTEYPTEPSYLLELRKKIALALTSENQ